MAGVAGKSGRKAGSSDGARSGSKTKSTSGRHPKKVSKIIKEMEGMYLGKDDMPVGVEEVRKLSALGCTVQEMANFFCISKDCLSYHFDHIIKKGREEQKIALRQAMMINACENHNASVQIFLAKNMLGMRDVPIDTEDTKPLPWSTELSSDNIIEEDETNETSTDNIE